MKQLLFFTVLLAVFGIIAFFYRSTVEAPVHNTNLASSTGAACQEDARVCPDGTSVSRAGPSCQFAACKAPNAELAQLGISFVVPEGYAANVQAVNGSLIAAYERTSMQNPKDAVIIRRYAIPEGEDANSVMLAETMYETSGNQPTSMSEFKPVIINNKTYQTLTVERFEAQVHTVYYLPREKDVLRFEALDHAVTNWTDPKLDVRTLPTHQALEALLGTFQMP